MNFKFYIFGVPDGFDLFPNRGDTNEIKYFQSFYDGSSERTKLSVRRNPDARVSYSFLKYNLTSGANRAGAFFGMSVVLEGEYCSDFRSLFELFETVYQDILKQGILLKKISDTQIRFGVYQLQHAEAEINRIENIIKVNLETSYSDDNKPLDNSFLQNASNTLLKINNEESNEYFLAALKQYDNIAISPEYKKGVKEEEEQIAPHILEEIYTRIASWESENKRFMFDTENTKLKNLFEVRDRAKGELQKAKENEIEKQFNLIIQNIRDLEIKSNEIISSLQKHLQKFPKHSVLLDLREYVNEFRRTLAGQRSAIEVYSDLIDQFGTHEAGGKKNFEPESKIQNAQSSKLSQFLHYKHKSKIITGAVLLLIVAAAFLWKPWQKIRNFDNCPECEAWLNQADSLQKTGTFANLDHALQLYKKAAEKGVNLSDKIEGVNAILVKKYIDSAKVEFDKGGIGNTKKIEAYRTAENLLKQIKEKGYGKEEDYNGQLAEMVNETKDYYLEKIKKAKTHEESEEYYKCLLDLDPTMSVDDFFGKNTNSSNLNTSGQSKKELIIIIKDKYGKILKQSNVFYLNEQYDAFVENNSNKGGTWSSGCPDKMSIEGPKDQKNVKIKFNKTGECDLIFTDLDGRKKSYHLKFIAT